MKFSAYRQNNQIAPAINTTSNARVQGDGAMALARAQGDFGNVLARGALSYIDKVNSAKALEANNEYNRLMSEKTLELMQKKEGMALDTVANYDKAQKDIMAQVQKKFGSYINYGAAGQAFREFTMRDNVQRRASMMRYQQGELEKYEATQLGKGLETCTNQSIAEGSTLEAVVGGINRTLALVNSFYLPRYGEERAKLEARKAVSALVGKNILIQFKNGNTSGAESILRQYGDALDSNYRSQLAGTIAQVKQAEHISNTAQQLFGENKNVTYDEVFARVKAENSGNGQGPNENSPGYKVAKMISDKLDGKIPAEWIWAQMAHETDGFDSELSREHHNYGGIKATDKSTQKIVDGGTPENDGTSYRHFDSDDEYADYAARNLRAYAEDGIFDAKDISGFAKALKRGEYYTDSEENYVNGLNNWLNSGAAISDYDAKQQADKIWAEVQTLRNRQAHQNNQYLSAAKDELNAWFFNNVQNGVTLEEAMAKVQPYLTGDNERDNPLKAWALSVSGGARKASAGSGAPGSAKNNPLFVAAFETSLDRDFDPKNPQEAYAFLEEKFAKGELSTKDYASGISSIKDWQAGSGSFKYSWSDLKKSAMADYRGENPDYIFSQAKSMVYEDIKAYRNKEKAEPPMKWVLQKLKDAVIEKTIDNGSLFGGRSVAAAELWDRGVADYEAVGQNHHITLRSGRIVNVPNNVWYDFVNGDGAIEDYLK